MTYTFKSYKTVGRYRESLLLKAYQAGICGHSELSRIYFDAYYYYDQFR